MALARLADGNLWVWSPIALSGELASAVAALGTVRYIVSPNKIHHLFLSEWAKRWPEARLYAPPGLARKRSDLHFAAELGDQPDPAWAAEIDQVIFRGSVAMQEVAFFTVLRGPLSLAILSSATGNLPCRVGRAW